MRFELELSISISAAGFPRKALVDLKYLFANTNTLVFHILHILGLKYKGNTATDDLCVQ